MFEPIELILDKPRRYFLGARALMRAEKEINKRRIAEGLDPKPIDYIFREKAMSGVSGKGGFTLEELGVLLWAGLQGKFEVRGSKFEVGGGEPRTVPGTSNLEPRTPEEALELLDQSPLSRGKILTAIWDHYVEVTSRPDIDDVGANDHSPENPEEKSPNGEPPGSNSGVLQ